MPLVKSIRGQREDAAPSNWERHLDLPGHRGVPEKAQRWYVRHVESFPKSVSLSALTAGQVTDYLKILSGRSQLAD